MQKKYILHRNFSKSVVHQRKRLRTPALGQTWGS